VKVGLIYLPEKKGNSREKVYYLSVSFIPRQHQKPVGGKGVSVPLVLEQQIPVVTE